MSPSVTTACDVRASSTALSDFTPLALRASGRDPMGFQSSGAEKSSKARASFFSSYLSSHPLPLYLYRASASAAALWHVSTFRPVDAHLAAYFSTARRNSKPKLPSSLLSLALAAQTVKIKQLSSFIFIRVTAKQSPFGEYVRSVQRVRHTSCPTGLRSSQTRRQQCSSCGRLRAWVG